MESLAQKYDRFAKVDEGAAVRESEAVRASESAVKLKEREAWRQQQALASDVRARWSRGELSDGEYARLAREAGVSAREVLAELKERVAQRRSTIDTAAVSRGDVAAVSHAAGVRDGAAALDAADAAALARAEERKAVATALLQRAHHAEALEGLNAALRELATLAEPAASSARARNVRAACLGNSALAHLALGAWAAAEAACDGVLALDARNVKALMRRAAARKSLGRLDGARADLDAARALEPANSAISAQRRELDAALAAAAAAAAPAAAGAPTVSPSPLARSYCYLDVRVDGAAAGRIVLQLFDEICPLTCANFYALCKGWRARRDDGADGAAELCYRGSPIHRVAKGLAIQGGDIVSENGAGAVSIYGATFADETFAVPHARPGVLSMANMGEPHTNGCQFFITTNAAPHLDRKHVAFGRVLRGMALVHRVENLPTLAGAEAPAVDVRIADCGVLEAASVSLDAADDDAVASYGADALVVAAARGDARMVAALVQAGAERDARVAVPVAFGGDESVEGLAAAAARAAEHGRSAERTALHVAAANGHAPVVRGLLDAGADADAFDSTGACALHLAVRDGRSAACVRALLDARADVGALTSSGATAAHLAAEAGDVPCLRALLAGGADAAAAARAAVAALSGAATDGAPPELDGVTPVPSAAPGSAAFDPAALGADGGDGDGDSARAAGADRSAAESAALAAGIGGLTPLHVAAAGDRAECVALLLAHGARALALAGGELSAVHIAAARGALGALDALLGAGAHAPAEGERGVPDEASVALANAPGGASGKRPVHSAAEHGASDALELLARRGADVRAVDARGSSALHWAALGGHVGCVQRLLELDAAVDAPTARGATALHVGSEHGKAHVVRALLAAGASANAAAKSAVAPLHAAAKSGSAECVQLLLDAGAEPDAQMDVQVDTAGHRTSNRKRAVHVAAEDGHAAVLRVLIGAKADVNALAMIQSDESTSFTSALFAARRGKHAEAVAVLEAAGAADVSRVEM